MSAADDALRQWARDPAARVPPVECSGASLLLAVDLGADPACPRREAVLDWLEHQAASGLRLPSHSRPFIEAADYARLTGDPALADWAAHVDRLLDHQARPYRPQPVKRELARQMMVDLVIGPRAWARDGSPGALTVKPAYAAFTHWECVCWAMPHVPFTRFLYVNRATGRFREWEGGSLPLAEVLAVQ